MNNWIKHIICACGFWFIALSGLAQSSDEQLAAHYFNSGELNKAVLYYNKLYKENPNSFYYNQLYKSYIELQQYKDAEKLCKKELKRNPGFLEAYVDLGKMYTLSQQVSKAEQSYDKAIKELKPSQSQVIRLAEAFVAVDEIDYAEATYLRGKKLLPGNITLNIKTASILGLKGNYEGMFQEYLDLLKQQKEYLPTVENALLRAVNLQEDDAKFNLLKNNVLKRIQKQPNVTVYNDLLIWLFIQRKNFNSAFVHAKAMDKREKGKGRKVLELARMCVSNRQLDIAEKCFEYIITLGSESPFYVSSKIELFNIWSTRLDAYNYEAEDLVKLDSLYAESLRELGKSRKTLKLIMQQANLRAFHMGNTQEAISLLQTGLEIPGLTKTDIAELKLQLGDALLLQGNIWDANIFYRQVELDFKHDVIGHEAKFRSARISFYAGEFEWAQTQLNVLKASTSKLISNDAMDLSLLITDNLALDTSTRAMELFAEADLLLYRNQDEAGLKLLDQLNFEFPGHSLGDEILFARYRVSFRHQDYPECIKLLEKIIEQYPQDILTDDAMFRLAELYEVQLDQLEQAQQYYKQLLLDFPGSLYVVEARKRYRKLRGDAIN